MTNAAQMETSVRDIDPTVKQRNAANPHASVWVGASAGTGKTKVLVDRLLRLLLPRQDGRDGTLPHRILCLTFTKAAASEMALRINTILSQWAVISTDDSGTDQKGLRTQLQELLGYEPSSDDIIAARRLFAQVVDTPGGLKIMTIHSFCQSVLGRFPLEAGLPPHFTVIDERQARELLITARDHMLRTARKNEDIPESPAFRMLATTQNESQFMSLLGHLTGERLLLEKELPGADDDLSLSAFHTKICALLDIESDADEDKILAAACKSDSFDESGLRSACAALATGTAASDQPKGIALQSWLDSSPHTRRENWKSYSALYLKSDGAPYKKLITGKPAQNFPEAEPALQAESLRIFDIQDKLRAVRCAADTRNLFILGRSILQAYQSAKERLAALDYDDLILRTLALLQKPDSAPWVLYKLDGGLDHVLIDEAQDTNPEQWQIISTLCDDFFSGNSAHDDIERTLFTVGDKKQSIYSFQRAAPQEFDRMKHHFATQIEAAAQKFTPETLNISFRSTKTVLRLVDTVFAMDPARQGMENESPEHISFRTGQAGLVELWPLFTLEDIPEEPPWTPPTTIVESRGPGAQLAEHIGTTIARWLDNKDILESAGRPVIPGDIMILVRTRTAFVGQLVRALKTRKIPVSGIDRMVLGEQLAVMDLLALARFALLPDDDLTLACILKSPLIGWTEDQLYEIAIDRQNQSLWQTLGEKGPPKLVDWLQTLIFNAAADHPYEFFSRVLQQPCPADPVSGLRAIIKRLGIDAQDPLDEFLNAALAFERDHIPALQDFLVWQQKEDIVIKREMEEAGNHVRIMTIHAAKGLQAPIVFLPDTIRTHASKRTPRLLWPDKSGLRLPLWSARSADDPALYQSARKKVEDRLDEEYRRLLYVAMTRAEERLYIAGYCGRTKPIDDSWYNYVSAGFTALGDTETIEFGSQTALRITDPRTRDPDRAEKSQKTPQEISGPLPAMPWMTAPPPEEPDPPRPLTPSRPSEEQPAAQSPLSRQDTYRFRRGNITHLLLQILPDLPVEKREATAAAYIDRQAGDLPDSVRRDVVRETMAILSHPDYAPLFGPGSQAEIPVTGYVNGRLVSGQIDRILVTKDAIWIIDYKTNRPPPTEEQAIPALYRQQMKSYRDIVANIYDDRPVRCFLLWTDGPHLMEVNL
ncbi:MAG: double-strand break repair helicase AddA [Rhodospirillales bacterium]|nr:double-strand break repair helicase AddA [Rhodospirillales bacterium]